MKKECYNEIKNIFEKYGILLTNNNCRKLPIDKKANETIGECTEDFYILTDNGIKPAYYRIGEEKKSDDKPFNQKNQKDYWYTHFPATVHCGFFDNYIAHEKNVFQYFLTKEQFESNIKKLETIYKKYSE